MTNTLIAFDFETTGLYPIKDKIVEIGAVRFNPEDNREIDTFKTFVNPGMPIPQVVINIHGITDEMVKNAPHEKDALLSFLDYIGDAPLMAHNVAFDVGFFMAAVSMYKIKPPVNMLLDSCELSRICFKNVENHKLSTLGKCLNIEQNGYHRALADAMVVMKLYKMCLTRLDNKMTVQDIANRTTSGLKFSDYIFDKIELPDDKIGLKQAIDKGRSVEIKYRNNKGDETQREITPFNIYSFSGKTYVSAYCHNCSEDRQFRLDRIFEVSIK
ncbi:MAG: WYL domain-containing protein [Planctomycetes bacterium]|nr:WYL domain-containing protein [Planctomycetota bacterium]